MSKQFWKKWLTGILCTALLFTNVLSTGIPVFATETETDISVVDENLDEENIENDEIADAVDEEEQEKKDPDEESIEGDEEVQDGAGTENEDGKKKDNIENETENPETEQEEDTDEEGEEKEIADDLISEDAENRTELIVASDDIASGISNYVDGENITWVINADGRLIVEGTGMYLTGA